MLPNAVKHFSDRLSRFFVAEVAQIFGHSAQTAESLGDFRYKMPNGVAPRPCSDRAAKFLSINRLARYPPDREGSEGYERGGLPLRSPTNFVGARRDFPQGARQTETSLGFNRRAVSRGLQELELGRPIRNRTQRRGRPRIEQHRQDISRITDEVLSENSQMDPKFQTTLAFTRVTGKGLRQALATSLNVALTSLPVS